MLELLMPVIQRKGHLVFDSSVKPREYICYVSKYIKSNGYITEVRSIASVETNIFFETVECKLSKRSFKIFFESRPGLCLPRKMKAN